LILARLFKAGCAVTVVLVAAATVDTDLQNQPSLPRLEMDALIVPALKTCHYPNLFSFAPEAQRILAGGETTGKPVIIAFAPR